MINEAYDIIKIKNIFFNFNLISKLDNIKKNVE